MVSSTNLPQAQRLPPGIVVSPPPRNDQGGASGADRRRRPRRVRILTPQEYSRAVLHYSLLPTGVGQNHRALGDFLTTETTPGYINISGQELHEPFVTLYRLVGTPEVKPDSDESREQDSGDSEEEERTPSNPIKQPKHFHDSSEFYDYKYNLAPSASPLPQKESHLVFLRGYMTADWLNHIGSKYVVDPEYFCRHLDFRPADENSNNFSIPALPSSSWHLIQLPAITIGTRDTAKGPMRPEKIEQLRQEGRRAVEEHHHTLSRLSLSGMSTGDSILRDFYVFDETHFAIEQRISICMQQVGSSFTLLIWLDSGKKLSEDSLNPQYTPWATTGVGSRLLPVIRHIHEVALKSHLFSDPGTDTRPAASNGFRDIQSVSRLHADYGRSLRPNLMGEDAFYALAEIFNFAASSEMCFLNLIDTKLDSYAQGLEGNELVDLQNLRYTRQILYRHIQKIEQVQSSIHNARQRKWSKSRSRNKHKANSSADAIESDFKHLLSRAEKLHKRCNEAITVLMSGISISESKRAIEQTERVAKLTFLAFIFVPLSFTTSFFGMNVSELKDNRASIYWWASLSIVILTVAMAQYHWDLTRPVIGLFRAFRLIVMRYVE
ncbi:hypothetical protein BDV06DRAFT_199476 [Aspergillus oleicola]